MSEQSDVPSDDDVVVLGQVVITRLMRDDDIVDHVTAEASDGSELALAEALGMMRLAEDTLIRSRRECHCDDEGEESD